MFQISLDDVLEEKEALFFFSWFETASDDSLSRAVTVAAADTNRRK